MVGKFPIYEIEMSSSKISCDVREFELNEFSKSKLFFQSPRVINGNDYDIWLLSRVLMAKKNMGLRSIKIAENWKAILGQF